MSALLRLEVIVGGGSFVNSEMSGNSSSSMSRLSRETRVDGDKREVGSIDVVSAVSRMAFTPFMDSEHFRRLPLESLAVCFLGGLIFVSVSV